MRERRHPKHILIVDGMSDNRELYARAMVLAGFRVSLAQDGRECVEHAWELVPDLIVMDLSLPKLDGLEATRRLKASPQTQWIPVLALSAYRWDTIRTVAFRFGCAGFLVKPCLPDTLLREIHRLLA